ncbi:MAG TPA: hypothetical protein VGG74_11785 [Kofleriaceae bacterium]|jgi:hypothetical protein
MSNPSALGAICYEAESAFGEDVTTFATARLPVLKSVDASGLKHNKSDSTRVNQRRQDGTIWNLGTMGGTFKTSLYLTGHGTSTSGAVSASKLETLLGYVIGTITDSPPAGTTLTGGTASIPITTASGTFPAGGLCRIGAQNDGRGNGQFLAIHDHTTTNLTLLTAMDGVPSDGDALYSANVVSSTEDPINGTGITGLRFLLQTANLQYECHGCVATAIAISGLNTGQFPTIDITWTVSWWRYSTSTFPSSVATETFQPAANAGGSLFMNAVGTATRAKRVFRDFTLDYKLGVVMLPGPGGVNPYQMYVGARRTVDSITVSWMEDADAATTTPVLPLLGEGTAAQHVLWTGNPTAGKAMGLYFPNFNVSNVAIQAANANINRLKITGMAYTGPLTTNDLTASAMRMGFA